MDPYAALGVSRDAQMAEIRSAHRKLVLRCHPDKVQDPDLKAQKQNEFQRVQEAYEILCDEDRRQKCDDQLRLAELRRQREANLAKANSSAPRSSPGGPGIYTEFEIRTAEPRSSSYKSSPKTPSGPPPGVRVYTTGSYSRSWEDEPATSMPARGSASSARYHDHPDIRVPRREKTYHDKPSKRETEREREKEKEREKERDREKRRIRKEREAEEARRAIKKEEKRAKEKQRSKDHKREKEDKRRERESVYANPYAPDDDDEHVIPSVSRRGSSSAKYDDPAYSRAPAGAYQSSNWNYAQAYIHSKVRRAPEPAYTTYHPQARPAPAAPTPPNAEGYSRPTTTDDDDGTETSESSESESDDEVLRSRARRPSATGPSTPRERPHMPPPRASRRGSHPSSPIIVDTSPPMRHSPRFSASSSAAAAAAAAELAGTGTSPPRNLSRTQTMPAEIPHARGMPMPPRRTQTYDYYTKSGGAAEMMPNRGRGRSRMESQVPEDTDESDSYPAPPRVRRSSGATVTPGGGSSSTKYHRSSRKSRPDEEPPVSRTTQYHVVEGGRTKKVSSSSARAVPIPGASAAAAAAAEVLSTSAGSGKSYYPSVRPGSYSREPSYHTTVGTPPFPRVNVSRPVTHADVQFSTYEPVYRGTSTRA